MAGEQQQTRDQVEEEIRQVRGRLLKPWEFTGGDDKARAVARLVELEGKRLVMNEAEQAAAAAAEGERQKADRAVLEVGERIRAAKTPEERAEAMKELDVLAAAERGQGTT